MSEPAWTLRAVRLDDAADLAEMQAQPRFRRGTLVLPFPSPDAVRRQLEARSPEDVDLAAVVDGKVVGRTRLQRGVGRRAHAGYIVTLGVHDGFQGRGIGAALLRALLDIADNWLDLKRLELGVWTDNETAIALYRRYGFAIEGYEKCYAFRDGRYVDGYTMARLRGGLEAARRGDDDALAATQRRDPMVTARRAYAEELRFTAGLRSSALAAAFATVPRERFLGPGPWRILSPMRMAAYWTTDDSDPRHLYHDVLVAIDEGRRLNNGQPSLWAALYDQLDLAAGEHVVHVGAGTGYYSAVLAEIVGRGGQVTAVEIDPDLASRARAGLVDWPQAVVVEADGFAFRPERPADAIVVNAGVSHLSPAWLDTLAAERGRLLVPLTNTRGSGAFLLIVRHAGAAHRYAARFVSWTGVIPCVGGRDPDAEARLEAALARSGFTAIRSLRRPPEAPDASCWLAGDGWWLSTAPLPGDETTAAATVVGLAGRPPS